MKVFESVGNDIQVSIDNMQLAACLASEPLMLQEKHKSNA